MLHLVVVVEGISLWINRGSFWDVLFPKAADTNHQHIPILEGLASSGSFLNKTDLTGHTLDLSHLPSGDGHTPPPHWMIPVRASASTSWANVIGSVRLPKGHLAPAGAKPAGLVDYGSHIGLNIDYGARWSMTFQQEGIDVVLRTLSDQSVVNPLQLPSGEAFVTLLIQNRTKQEHDFPDQIEKSKPGEEIKEVGDVHRILGMSDKPLPVFKGRSSAPTPAASSPSGAIVDPDKLCPPCILI